MGKQFSRLLISGVAVAVILARILRPEIKVDPTTLVLLAVAVSPWLSSVIKGIEVPGGIKLEYRDGETPTAASPQPQTEPPHTGGNKELNAPRSDIPPKMADSYLDRLVKLTPVEPIALFLVLSSLIQSTPTRLGTVLTWSIFGALLIISPLFFWKMLGVRLGQAGSMAFAFCVWIFAIGGPFNTLHWYRPWYGGLVLALYISLLPSLKFK